MEGGTSNWEIISVCKNSFSIYYTEPQKKHHFSRAALTKIHNIQINHIWTQISYSSPYEAHDFVQEEKSAVNLQKVIFQKSQTVCWEPPRKAAYMQ